jgi:thermostable 8-oxoguanine DNA glycosylase
VSAAHVHFRSKGDMGLSVVWWELVYCVLAGSQIPMESARKSLNALKEILRDPDDIQQIRAAQDVQAVDDLLRASGYRYHHTKAMAISAAAEFALQKYEGDLRRFVGRPVEVSELERELHAHL